MRLEQIRQASIYGIRPKRTFREATIEYLRSNADKVSLSTDAIYIKMLDEYIGHLPIESIHMNSLKEFIKEREKSGAKTRTINYALQIVRRILRLAADDWKDENNLTWLQIAPKIKLLKEKDKREPYPLQVDEETRLFNELPQHLKQMAIFAVNTGCRSHEICHLKWKWEIKIPEGSVFMIPAEEVKKP
ncbi:site-specific integrase [Candidatus Rickettsiella viridis]|uniref:hypothetical protein n=1 Tax=Candidatus Rickettsiella viridis TaxID=676208 RepID=UPI001E5D6066|nr:hypothetical protein [Candidatus Rickettsiella viridis]